MSFSNERSLNGCISSLTNSVSLLNSSLSSLEATTADFGRLKHVLNHNRIFTLVPEYDLLVAKQDMGNDVEPKIMKLMELIRGKLVKLERKNANLKSKIELNNVRINNLQKDSKLASYSSIEIEGDEHELDQLKQLSLQKDRLKYKLSSLKLQKRKERLSMVNK